MKKQHATADLNLDELRDRLLDAALVHVPFDGWTAAVLNAAARDLGISHAQALAAFPGGAADMIDYWNRRSDERMLQQLAERDLSELRYRDRVALAVRLRLEAAGHREAVRRGLAYLSMPQNAALAARCLYRTVDTIWHGLGDRSTDFSFYTKRALLAGVYSATVLYWLDDRSEGSAATWAFLDRRIDDVMKIGKAREGLERLAERLNPFSARRPLTRASRRMRRTGRPRDRATSAG